MPEISVPCDPVRSSLPSPVIALSAPNPASSKLSPLVNDTVGNGTAVGNKVFRRRLRPTKQQFVTALTTPNQPGFLNATASYTSAHPTAKRTSAGNGGYRMMKDDEVRKELEALGWGKERLEAELQRNMDACWNTQRLDLHQSAVEKLAKLTGIWTEKQEVTHLEDAQKEAIRREVSKALGSN